MRLCRTCEAEGARVRQVFTADELAFLCGAAVDQMRKVAQMTPEHKASLPPGMLKGRDDHGLQAPAGNPARAPTERDRGLQAPREHGPGARPMRGRPGSRGALMASRLVVSKWEGTMGCGNALLSIRNHEEIMNGRGILRFSNRAACVEVVLPKRTANRFWKDPHVTEGRILARRGVDREGAVLPNYWQVRTVEPRGVNADRQDGRSARVKTRDASGSQCLGTAVGMSHTLGGGEVKSHPRSASASAQEWHSLAQDPVLPGALTGSSSAAAPPGCPQSGPVASRSRPSGKGQPAPFEAFCTTLIPFCEATVTSWPLLRPSASHLAETVPNATGAPC